MIRRFAPAFLFAFTLVLSPADASLRLCNRTSYIIYTATAAQTGGDIAVHGWTRVVPGACMEAIKGDLAGEAYYLYARSSRAHSGPPRDWSGQVSLCVQDTNFSTRTPFGARCTGGAYALGFAQINTHHMRSWTTTFREAPDIASMEAAGRAGLRRLLGDLGVRNLASDKAADRAVAQFKKRMRLNDRTPLFDALETEAMKSAAPACYTICNDTKGEVWAALGEERGGVFTSRGWWTIAGRACAPLLTEPLTGRKFYLRVERPKGAPLVAGATLFCVTNIAFDIQGRDRCVARGLKEQGFAETNTGGLPGFTARVTANGLAPK